MEEKLDGYSYAGDFISLFEVAQSFLCVCVCVCIYFCFVRSLPHSKMVSWKNALQKMPMTNIYMKKQSRSIFIPHKMLNEIEVIEMCRTAMPFNCMNFPMFIFLFFFRSTTHAEHQYVANACHSFRLWLSVCAAFRHFDPVRISKCTMLYRFRA